MASIISSRSRLSNSARTTQFILFYYDTIIYLYIYIYALWSRKVGEGQLRKHLLYIYAKGLLILFRKHFYSRLFIFIFVQLQFGKIYIYIYIYFLFLLESNPFYP